jgi:hypothetical protein
MEILHPQAKALKCVQDASPSVWRRVPAQINDGALAPDLRAHNSALVEERSFIAAYPHKFNDGALALSFERTIPHWWKSGALSPRTRTNLMMGL